MDATHRAPSGDLRDRPVDMLGTATAQYKLAKEAFHTGNLGSSIMSINVISLAALVSMAAQGDVQIEAASSHT